MKLNSALNHSSRNTTNDNPTRVVSVYNDENHELVQPFDEVIAMAIYNPKLQST
jgi:hypothetical protein